MSDELQAEIAHLNEVIDNAYRCLTLIGYAQGIPGEKPSYARSQCAVAVLGAELQRRSGLRAGGEGE